MYHIAPSMLLFKNKLPEEVHIKIFSYLDGTSLQTVSCINTVWGRLLNEDTLWKQICHDRGFCIKEKDCTWKETIGTTYQLRRRVKIAVIVMDRLVKVRKILGKIIGSRDIPSCRPAFTCLKEFKYLDPPPADYQNLINEIGKVLEHLVKEKGKVPLNKLSEGYKKWISEMEDQLLIVFNQIFDTLSLKNQNKKAHARALFQTLIDNYSIPKLNFSKLTKILEPHYSQAYRISEEEMKSPFFPHLNIMKQFNTPFIKGTDKNKRDFFIIQYYFHRKNVTLTTPYSQLFIRQHKDSFTIEDIWNGFFHRPGWNTSKAFGFHPDGKSLLQVIQFISKQIIDSPNIPDVNFTLYPKQSCHVHSTTLPTI